MRRRCLIIFAKAPRLAQVKRRLAAGIGDVEAWRFYQTTMRRVLIRLARDRRWRTSLFMAPDRFAHAPGDWPKGAVRFAQGPGDLGARMGRAFRAQPPGPVVLVGTDIPSLGAGHIDRAFRALGRADVVFGPAADGGYWLIGLARRRGASVEFKDVRWSTRYALADTCASLPKNYAVAMIDTLEDVDDRASYERLGHVGPARPPGVSGG
ncbi:MAG: TIGR04282 family arsenosugar biosynthesis glycosyltransferase [Alphaproteobacteria bacterium]